MEIGSENLSAEGEQKMRTKQPQGAQFFLNKLYDILSTPEHSHIICWAGDGDRFNILNPKALQKEIIPVYFKHKNLKSFVRQLNLHGFKKIRVGARITESTIDSYRHTHFRQNRPDLVSQIKRKVPKPLSMEEPMAELLPSFDSTQVELALLHEELERQKTEAVDGSLLKFYADCTNSRYGPIILKALEVFQDFKEGELASDCQIGHYVYQLTSDYIANLTRFIQCMADPAKDYPTSCDAQRNESLGKRTPESSAKELQVFKQMYKVRSKPSSGEAREGRSLARNPLSRPQSSLNAGQNLHIF